MNTVLAGIVIVFFGMQGIARLTADPAEQHAAAYHFGVSIGEYRKFSALMILGGAGLAAGLVIPPLGIAAAVGLIGLMVIAAGLRYLCQDGAFRVALPLVIAVLTAGYLTTAG
ncbi:DoxX family protein [Actinoplanes sp. NEAU-A12]|uniref:DoxX family protein n=1 Tax=Actinoplanes sandaracinus TaxID=3045177 RepID=A0ABT6WQ09_9ACTN|nr:DoxX family protein [Actinoplanes sandaracinus]MDI6101813.1 DoxX family protein [Actinoplanes sandaracinus]